MIIIITVNLKVLKIILSGNARHKEKTSFFIVYFWLYWSSWILYLLFTGKKNLRYRQKNKFEVYKTQKQWMISTLVLACNFLFFCLFGLCFFLLSKIIILFIEKCLICEIWCEKSDLKKGNFYSRVQIFFEYFAIPKMFPKTPNRSMIFKYLNSLFVWNAAKIYENLYRRTNFAKWLIWS